MLDRVSQAFIDAYVASWFIGAIASIVKARTAAKRFALGRSRQAVARQGCLLTIASIVLFILGPALCASRIIPLQILGVPMGGLSSFGWMAFGNLSLMALLNRDRFESLYGHDPRAVQERSEP